MSDEKYTQKEREFLRLHELEHTLYSIERTIIERVGPRGLVNKSSNDRLRAWHALDVLRDSLLRKEGWTRPQPQYGEAADMVINKALAEDVCEGCGEAAPQGRDYCERFPNCFVVGNAKKEANADE